MNRILSMSVLMFSILISCGSKENKTNIKEGSTKIPDFTKSFEGTINGKYEIIMTLAKSSTELSGTYTYKSQGSPMKISGSIDDNGNLTLNEVNAKGKVTGIFKGQLADNKLSGNWSKPDGSHTMPFSLSETTNQESSFMRTETKEKNDWTGTYVDKYGGSLKIKGPDAEGGIKFEILQVSEDCEGSGIEGVAYLNKSWLANYIEDGGTCNMSFTYNENYIEIMEYDCGDYHGAHCGTFDGKYNKK